MKNYFKQYIYDSILFSISDSEFLRNLNLYALAQKVFCMHMKAFTKTLSSLKLSAFTLVEMLMALLIVSVILSASLPIISQRQKAMASNYNQNRSFPIGGVILWTDMNKLPDNTWMECNGTAIPNGIEYEQARRVFGGRLPDLRNNSMEYINNLNTYLSNDIKNYLQNAIKPIPKNVIAIWGSNDAIPDGWSEAAEYRGVFLRGYGSISHTQNNGSTIGNSATTHSSGAIGSVQGDSIREIWGSIYATVGSGRYAGNGVFSPSGQYFDGGSFDVVPGGMAMSMGASRVTPVSNEIRPINKSVKFIKYTNAPTLPDIPNPPQSKIYYRYIAKVRY